MTTTAEPGDTEHLGLLLAEDFGADRTLGTAVHLAEVNDNPSLVARVEKSEAEFMFAYESGTPAAPRAELGLRTTRIGGGAVLSMAKAKSRYWSKALGLGVEEPVTGDLIGRILDFYRENQDPTAALQIAPSLLPPDWAEICTVHQLSPGGRALKLTAPIDVADLLDRTGFGRTELKIAPVTPEHVEEWAALILSTFGMTDTGLVDMLAASLDQPAFHPFAAWDGPLLVAAGNLHVQDGVGSLNTGATLTSHRGRGAQSALIAARIEHAASLGCRWLVSETGKAGAGERNPSTENMRRAGLNVVYARQNWLWSAQP